MSSLLSPRLRLFLPRVRLVRLQSSVARCPSCSRPLPANLPACTSCWTIRPLPPDTSHHELFNLGDKPNPFLVHLPTLKERFRQAQAACHPDAWATKSPRDRDLAHTLSSRLNEAYQTLLNPLSRAEYILERNGVHISEADQVEDLEFMGDIMEQREAIEEADAGDSESVHRIVEENDEKIESTIKDLTDLIERQDWPEVKAAAIRLRYLEGIRRAAKQWLDNH